MKNALFLRAWPLNPRSLRAASRLLGVAAVVSVAAPSGAQEPTKPESLADIPDEEWVDEPEPEKPVLRSGFVWLPHLGVAVAGSGTLKAELALDCEAGACTSAVQERDYTQNPNIVVGFDTLYHVLPSLRLGLGLQWMPTSDVDVTGGNSNTEFGSELSPTAVVEGVFGGKSAGALRGFVGANLLFPDGELEEVVDSMDAECRSIDGAGGSCSVASGPYVGLTLGAAAAFLRQLTDSSALRLELMLQYVRFAGPSLDVSDSSGTRYKDALSWSGTRFSVRFGVEF